MLFKNCTNVRTLVFLYSFLFHSEFKLYDGINYDLIDIGVSDSVELYVAVIMIALYYRYWFCSIGTSDNN